MELSIDSSGILVRCGACGKTNRLRYATLGSEARCGQCKSALGPASAPLGVHSAGDFRALAAGSALPVLVDFWAPWCGPCKMVAPELEKVAAGAAGRFLVAKVNTDELQEVAAQFQIASIPTLAVLRGGREIARQAGAAPAAGIERFVEQAIGK